MFYSAIILAAGLDGVKFFSSLSVDISVNETCSKGVVEQAALYSSLGVLIVLLIKSSESAPPHKHVLSVSLKRAIHDKSVKLEFGETDFEQWQTSLEKK